MKALFGLFRQVLQETAVFLRQHSRLCFILSLFLVFVLGCFDHLTRYEFGFLIFYFVPIVLAAWFSGLWPAIVVALAATIAWFVADYNAYKYSSDFYRYWNLAIRLVTFLVNAVTTYGIRRNMEEYQLVRAEKARLEKQLHEVTDLLPVCHSCGRTRDDPEYLQRVTRYLEAAEEKDSKGNLCPECLTRKTAERREGDR